MAIVKLEDLKVLTKKAIKRYGYDDIETEKICDVLLYAQMRGNNQGIVKLVGSGIPKSPETGTIKIEKETKLSVQIDGAGNHAMVVVGRAVEIAIQKAKEHGIGIVGTHGFKTSSGAIGYYANAIASQSLVGFVFAGSMETVAVEGSYEPILGTNPIAIGVPTENEPLVLDMATAAMAYYGVIEANIAGKPLPEGIGYDAAGNLTTDASKVLDGALRTFDKGYKGSGLSMMVQILTGPLVGAAFTGIGDTANNWGGHCIIAIDPELLNGLDNLRAGVTQMIAKIKGVKKLPGISEIYVPGEKGNLKTKTILQSGEIEIEDNLYAELSKIGSV